MGLIYGFISGILEKPTWEGDFQIVLSKNSSGISGGSQRSMLLNSFGLDASNNQLTTEVKILGSPSVLMPTLSL